MRRLPLVPLVVALALAAGCRDAARAVAPLEPTAAAGEAGARLDLAGAAPALDAPAALTDAQAATSDARDRVVPTLTEGPTRTALTDALDRLDHALAAGDPLRATDALAGAQAALDGARAAALDAPAEFDVVALALGRVDALLAPVLP